MNEYKPQPRFLYHGTTDRWLPNILRVGIEPRGDRQSRNNWKHVRHQSNKRCVYMSDSYAPFFAHNACGDRPGEMAAIFEIDLHKLDPENLFPDEDFLEQVSRGRDGDDRDMSTRTLAYRRRQFKYGINCYVGHPHYTSWWWASVASLGTCSHRGTIPVSAISRVVTYPFKKNIHLMFVWDPSISLMNQMIAGQKYQTLTKKLFDGEFTDPDSLPSMTDMHNKNLNSEEYFALRDLHTLSLPPIEGWAVENLHG